VVGILHLCWNEAFVRPCWLLWRSWGWQRTWKRHKQAAGEAREERSSKDSISMRERYDTPAQSSYNAASVFSTVQRRMPRVSFSFTSAVVGWQYYFAALTPSRRPCLDQLFTTFTEHCSFAFEQPHQTAITQPVYIRLNLKMLCFQIFVALIVGLANLVAGASLSMPSLTV
jgi:hypothetical protein